MTDDERAPCGSWRAMLSDKTTGVRATRGAPARTAAYGGPSLETASSMFDMLLDR